MEMVGGNFSFSKDGERSGQKHESGLPGRGCGNTLGEVIVDPSRIGLI